MEKTKLRIWLPLLFSIVMVAGMYIGFKMRDGMPGKSFFYRERSTPLNEILNLIDRKYVDSVNIQALADTAIEAILSRLDPHTTYIPAAELEQVNDDIAGSFYGIGIEFNIFDDTIHVTNVLKDGPAFKAGIKTGDKILKAGDSITSGKKIESYSVRKILRGMKGSTINLLMLRDYKKLNVPVTRDMIPVSSIDAAYMIDSSIGYMRLNIFSKQTYREFMQSLESLKKQGLKKLILDLRDNGGGVLDEAIEIADEFLDGDKLITYIQGAHSAKKEYRCRREGQFETGELIILENEGTASASEVLIGALQDWDRAIVVGRRSFGKGLVQEQYNLSNNSAIRLTVARYYTPLGRSIQRSYTKGAKAYFEEIASRFSNGEIYSADSVINDTSKIYITKKGKKLFGMGGLSPDYFIAADSGIYSKIVSRMIAKGLLNNYGYKFIMQNPLLTQTYKTPQDFVKKFSIDKENWKIFVSMAAQDSIKLDSVSVKEKYFIARALKTSVARQLFRNEGLFETLNIEDNGVKKAVELLRK